MAKKKIQFKVETFSFHSFRVLSVQNTGKLLKLSYILDQMSLSSNKLKVQLKNFLNLSVSINYYSK